jgi:PAP2 superfamily
MGAEGPWRAVWREQRPLLVLVAGYTAAVALAEWVVGLPVPLGNVGFANFYFLFAVAAVCYLLGAVLRARALVRSPDGRWDPSWRAWPLAWAECRRRYFNPYRLGTAVVASAAILLLLRTYSSWKPLIPLVRPYGELDVGLMRLDRALHLGHDPWRLIQPLLGRPAVTLAVDLLYALWLPLNFAVVLWQASSTRAAVRDRFLLSYALLWILLGTAAATAWSSVGPCYYGRIVAGPDVFAPLMSYLGEIHADRGLIALKIQENLWTYYLGREVLPLNGISAMPSMHVAGALLFALAGRRVSASVGWALGLYFVIVLVGSVHLGWHYAVDGYAGALAAWIIWWGVGGIMGRREHRRSGGVRGGDAHHGGAEGTEEA